jgi:hypothetical protein
MPAGALKPRRASITTSAEPAHLAPTITTSNRFTLLLRSFEGSLIRDALQK